MKKGIFSSIFITIFFSSLCSAYNYFLLEGTTGAGKSTLIYLLEKELEEVHVVNEQVDKILDVGGNGNLLELFYKDHKRWAYLFQTYAFIIRDEAVNDAIKKYPEKIILADRSIYSTFYVFGNMLHEKNLFHELEWYVYQQWFIYSLEKTIAKPKGFIYLRTTPDVCFQRVKKRNRLEEQGAPYDYYKNEFDFHEKWLIDKNIDHEWLKDVPVLILDGNQDFLHDEEVLQKMVCQIKSFISQITNTELS